MGTRQGPPLEVRADVIDSIGERSASEIAALAERVFGSSQAARDWLLAPNPALSDQKPSRLLATRIGGRQVEAVLIRIEHGVFE
jgi:putative toxin-antitoxin system antitoxin component (TIGR02293 family)